MDCRAADEQAAYKRLLQSPAGNTFLLPISIPIALTSGKVVGTSKDMQGASHKQIFAPEVGQLSVPIAQLFLSVCLTAFFTVLRQSHVM